MNTSAIRHSSLLLAGALATTLLLSSGCTSVPLDKEGEMVAVYAAGEFRMLVNGSAAATVSATSAAFKQLGLVQIRSKQTTFAATMLARTVNDEKVTIKIDEVNSRQSIIRIRRETVGDKVFSRRLYEQIDRNLSNGGSW